MVLGTIVAGLLLYLLSRLKRRRARLLSDLEDRPELNQDRAFNRLAMARREAGILVNQGVDIQRPQELIAEAQSAFDLRHYDQAYQLAQSAHEALVNARSQGSMAVGNPLPSSGMKTPSTGAMAPGAAPVSPPVTPASVPPSPPPIPKNRAESQFQIRLLGDELAGLPTRRAQEPSASEATALRDQAKAAFDQGNYTDAFRLALRGRRTLGATVESLPPASAVPAGPTVGTPSGDGAATPDATRSAEAAAGAERCPDCGYPALPGDSFCRGCGRPRSAQTCLTCGAPRVGDEAYCGRCGSRFP